MPATLVPHPGAVIGQDQVTTMVCGAPSSGNKLTRDLLNHIQMVAGETGLVSVYHTPKDIRDTKERWPNICKAVIPVRCQPFQERSFKANKHDEKAFPPLEELLPQTLNTLQELGIEYRIITYEGLIKYPETVVRELCKSLSKDP